MFSYTSQTCIICKCTMALMDGAKHDPCPHCGADLDAGDVYDTILHMHPEKAPLDIAKMAALYCCRRFSRRIIVQPWETNAEQYDICPDCKSKL